MPQNMKYWVWLSSIPGLGSKRCSQLLEVFGTPEDLWKTTEKELHAVPGMTDGIVKKLMDEKLRENSNLHMENIHRHHIKVITIEQDDYPDYLKNIYDPPMALYVRGEMKQEKVVAIVGSRKATSYGLGIAERLAYDLTKRGITVISGMARGVDSFAHRGALNAGGRTLAVLGCGPDIIYPPENGDLMEKIMASGAVISEYLPGFPPIPQNFPARNRIISGISRGVVIIEANEKSGSLITANFALEQGREVFAVPGNVTSITSKGTNKLIKDGAKMVMDVEDIIEELNFFDIFDYNNGGGYTKESKKQNSMLESLQGDERSIAECLQQESLHIDLLAQKSGLSMQNVSAILVMLELQGVIEQLPGKIFKLRN